MAYYIEEKKNVSPNPCVVLLDYRISIIIVEEPASKITSQVKKMCTIYKISAMQCTM